MDISAVASFLQDALGQKLVGYIVGINDHKAVGAWASGERSPRSTSEEKLRTTFQIFNLLQESESEHTVRAWFVGLNPQLFDQSPATVLREGDARDVLIAAKSFLAGA